MLSDIRGVEAVVHHVARVGILMRSSGHLVLHQWCQLQAVVVRHLPVSLDPLAFDLGDLPLHLLVLSLLDVELSFSGVCRVGPALGFSKLK